MTLRLSLGTVVIAAVFAALGACSQPERIGPPFADVIPNCSDTDKAPKRWFENMGKGRYHEGKGIIETAERGCRGDNFKVWMKIDTFRFESDAMELMDEKRSGAGTVSHDANNEWISRLEDEPPLPSPAQDAMAWSFEGWSLFDNTRDDGSVPDFEDWTGIRGTEVAFRIDNHVATFIAEATGPIVYIRGFDLIVSFSATVPEGMLDRLAKETLNRWPN